MRSPNASYLPAIDHLRALAALLILGYHGLHIISYQLMFHQPFTYDRGWPVANVFNALVVEGHLAVSLFMVLSGFIFTRAAMDQSVQYGAFIKNRLLRTGPLVVLLIALGAITHPHNLSITGILQLLLIGQMRDFVDGKFVTTYFDGGVYTGMFWAVTVEWHFYLLFPFLQRFLARADGIRTLMGFWLALFVIRNSALVFNVDTHQLSYMTILGRIDQFLAGMLLAAIGHRRPQLLSPFSAAWSRYLGLAGGLVVLSLYACWFNQLGSILQRSPWRALACTGDALTGTLFILVYIKFCGARRYRPLAIVGEMSYSIYLLHMVVMDALMALNLYLLPFPADQAYANASVCVLLLMLPITLAVSWLSYRYIEKPFLDLRVRYLQPATPEPPTVA